MATAVNLSLSTESFPPHPLTHYTLTIPTFPPPYHHPHSTTTFIVRFSLSFFSLTACYPTSYPLSFNSNKWSDFFYPLLHRTILE